VSTKAILRPIHCITGTAMLLPHALYRGLSAAELAAVRNQSPVVRELPATARTHVASGDDAVVQHPTWALLDSAGVTVPLIGVCVAWKATGTRPPTLGKYLLVGRSNTTTDGC
jgi:hypothetical protein